jgi:hypothetical protein
MNNDVATGRKMKGREGFIFLPVLSWEREYVIAPAKKLVRKK